MAADPHSSEKQSEHFIAAAMREVDAAGDDVVRCSSLHHSLGLIIEQRCEDQRRALHHYLEAQRLTPDCPAVNQTLNRIYAAGRDWNMAVRALAVQPDIFSDGAQKARLLLQQGRLYEDCLDNPAAAAEAYQNGLAQNPDDRQILFRLRRLCSRVGDHPLQVETCQRWASMTQDPDLSALLNHQAGRLLEDDIEPGGEVGQEEVGDQEDLPIKHYRRALDLVPDHEPSLRAMSRRLSRQGRWEEMANLLELALEHAEGRAWRVDRMHRLGELYQERLADAERAAGVLRRALSEDEGDLTALDFLAEAAWRQGDHASLCGLLDRLARRAVDDRDALAYLYEMAATIEDHLPELDPVAVYQRISQAEATEPRVLESLERIYHQRGDRESLILIWSDLLPRTENPARRESLLLQLAGAQEATGDLHGAAGTLAEAVEDTDNWIVAHELQRLQLELGQWPLAVKALEHAARLSLDGSNRADYLMAAARLADGRLHEPEPAIDALSCLLQLRPLHQEGAEMLDRLLEEQGEYEELASSLAQRIELLGALKEPQLRGLSEAEVVRVRIRTLTRLAEIQQDKLMQPERALETLVRCAQIDAGHAPTLLRLGALCMRLQRWHRAVEVYWDLVRGTDNEAALCTAHRRLGELYGDKLGDHLRAVSSYQNVLTLAPDDLEALQRLYLLFIRAGDQGNAMELRERLRALKAAGAEEQPVRLESRLEHRSVCRTAPGDAERKLIGALVSASLLASEGRLDEALAEHQQALQMDLLHEENLRQMSEVLIRAGRQDSAYAAVVVLRCLDRATEEELRFYRDVQKGGVRFPRQAIQHSAFETILVHPEEHMEGRQVLAMMGQIAHLLRPQRMEDWGVGSENRLLPHMEHPLRAVVVEVASLLGLEQAPDIYISDLRRSEMDLLFVDPPALVVGQDVLEALPAMVVRCWIGKLLSYLRNQTWIAHGYSPRQLRRLVWAACQATGITLEAAQDLGASDDEASALSARIKRALDRRMLQELQQSCQALALVVAPDFNRWALAMELTAIRTAVWVINELETVLDLLVVSGRDPAGGEIPEGGSPRRIRRGALQDPLFHEAVRFWLSEEFSLLVSDR